MRASATTLEAEMTDEELAFLLSSLRSNDLSGLHLEIGTAAGGTLWRMMQSFADGERPRFVVVDSMAYFPNQLETVRENLSAQGLDPSDVEFRLMSSAAAWERARLSGESYSFILIDAAHKIRYVMDDLRWGELLEGGGLLCLHDYSPAFPGVTKAVDHFLAKNTHYQVLGQKGSLLAIRKQGLSHGPEVTLADRLFALAWAPVLQLAPSVRKRLGRT